MISIGLISRLLLIAIIVILILAFIPKHNGTVICYGCEDRACKCFGINNDREDGQDVCIGIPYDCQTVAEPATTDSQNI